MYTAYMSSKSFTSKLYYSTNSFGRNLNYSDGGFKYQNKRIKNIWKDKLDLVNLFCLFSLHKLYICFGLYIYIFERDTFFQLGII